MQKTKFVLDGAGEKQNKRKTHLESLKSVHVGPIAVENLQYPPLGIVNNEGHGMISTDNMWSQCDPCIICHICRLCHHYH